MRSRWGRQTPIGTRDDAQSASTLRRSRATHADTKIRLIGRMIQTARGVKAVHSSVEAASANDANRKLTGQVRAVDAPRRVLMIPVLTPLPFVAGKIRLPPPAVTPW